MEDHSHDGIFTKLEFIREKINDIHIQTTQTNGRVKKLELWKSFLLGIWAVSSIIGGFLLSQIGNFNDNIEENIQDTCKNMVNENIYNILQK